MTPNCYLAFFHVGLYRGMTEAANRRGNSGSASNISMQIAELESHYGTPLFIRRPFALTPKGQILFDHCQKFFGELPDVEKKIREKDAVFNIGGPEVVLQNYLDDELNLMRKQFPKLQLNLRDGDQSSLEEALRRQEVNVAATIFDKKPNKRLRSLPLLPLPLALVVPAKSKWKSAEQVLAALSRRDIPISETLLMLPPKHAITRNFRAGLKQREIIKFSISEYDTTSLIESYARKEHGIGVSVVAPGSEKIKGLRFLPLSPKEFATVTFGLLWQTPVTPQLTAFIEAVKAKAKKI